jgi:sterol desaturase/sphingolipid hydroxylase (fatty acid hydroxylase superfamily)
MYETLHALYHLPDATLDRAGIGRLRLFRRLQAHHAHHHILGRMAHVNFNVTFPLMDRLLGTNEDS